MADCVEKKEFGLNERLYQHREAGNHTGDQDDDVDDSDDIKRNVAWAGQGFLEEGHFDQ